ncbi:MAG: hypothetical protein JJU34_04705 [Lunatimonas sp.]|uniref:hypothetical protein n=1 Tax=Lunatimonas sp. TaxID=2060141 RepID=UPI00263B9E27|nr:hypothetical protein [Lunatimonas sp.]MCC5936559.1 hypothetical protein [Lunatimonas sp.]
MPQTITMSASAVKTESVVQITPIPTYVYASVFASLCIAVGLLWDISWHMSVGRDGLFSPPHLSMYLGAVIAGVFSGVKVLKTSFFSSKEEQRGSIPFWGIFRGSLGALFCIWGAFAMLTSAPFDDWWHNTYGLDVKILSPPHLVLGLGMMMIQFGAMVSVLSVQNNLRGEVSRKTQTHLKWLFALSAGFVLVMVYTIISEFFFVNRLHGATAYQVAAVIFPLLIIPVAYASPFRWGGTVMALAYTFLMAAMVWILPLFPAEPKLSPIYNHITHFQPYHFPLLLIFPAIGIDLAIRRWRTLNRWVLAAVLGLVFLAVFVPVQWYFADFLNTEVARGWFFGRSSWPYSSSPDWAYRYVFHPNYVSSGMDLVKGLGIAGLLGLVSARVALAWGSWMEQVKR